MLLVTYINGLPVEAEMEHIVTVAEDQSFQQILKPTTDIPQYVVNNYVISDSETIDQPKDHHKTALHHRSMKRRHGNRKINSTRIHHNCRITETTTVKPTKHYNALPNIFISQNWGPGR